MRFYYISIFSFLLLGLIYLIGTGVLTWFGLWLRKRWKRAWMLMVPLFLLVYAGPVAEEFWIAWNFGRLCSKDAGLFVYKTVEVDGFYDATRPTTPVPRSDQAARDLDQGGYRFYEMVYPDMKGGPNKVVHLEKVHGLWTPTELDRPTARYHFSMDSGRDIGHKIKRQESQVTDMETGESVGKYRVYTREAPWFFIGLGRPNMGCDSAEGGPHSTNKNSFLIYRDVLKPIDLKTGESK